jgi:hypothetical protein
MSHCRDSAILLCDPTKGTWVSPISLLPHPSALHVVSEECIDRSQAYCDAERCHGKPAIEITRVVRIDPATAEVNVPEHVV